MCSQVSEINSENPSVRSSGRPDDNDDDDNDDNDDNDNNDGEDDDILQY